jgi:hypothetical protein
LWMRVHHIKAAAFRMQMAGWQEGQYHVCMYILEILELKDLIC